MLQESGPSAPGAAIRHVEAETDMHLLVLNSREFSTLMEDVPSVGRKVLAAVAERLREAERPSLTTSPGLAPSSLIPGPPPRRRHASPARPPAGGLIARAKAAAGENPGDHRVRVPHLAGRTRRGPRPASGLRRTRSSTWRAWPSSSASRCGLSTASAMSGTFPPRQTRIS